MKIEENNHLTFDDVLLKPQFSEIDSRSNVDISSKLGDHTLKIPIISAGMDTVTELEMAIAMNDAGGMGVLHRKCTIKEQVTWVKEFFRRRKNGIIGAAIGIKGDDLDRAIALMEVGCQFIVIDIAHGHCKKMHWMIDLLSRYIGKNILKTKIIAGNVATYEGAQYLYEAGATAIKCGIGSGSICTTRIKTGHGVPQLTAISDCRDGIERYDVIADGGIRSSGDIVKSLAMGASFVMVGNLLARTKESCGLAHSTHSKEYNGMAAGGKYSEGVHALVTQEGTVEELMKKLAAGIASGLSYSGAKNIKEFQDKAIFIKMTNNGLKESHPHDLVNYSDE